MDDRKNVRPDFSKAGEDSALYQKSENKTERQKLNELHGSDKAVYLLQYYGFKALLVVAVVGVAAFLIIQHFVQKQPAMTIMAVNAIQMADNPVEKSDYYNDFLNENGIDTSRNEVVVSSGFGASPDKDDSVSTQNIQMIQNRFMTQSVDVFLSDYDFFYSMGEFDYFADVREYLSDEELETYKNRIVYVKSVETGTEYPVGIQLSDNAWIDRTKWYPDGCVIGIAAGSQNRNLAEAFVDQVLN